jgi:hypothetical protein
MHKDSMPHITDSELLQAADGELSNRRVAEIQTHLASCWTCRAHNAEIENAISGFVQGYELERNAALPPIEQARVRLEASLASLAESSSRSFRDRTTLFIFDIRRLAFVGGGLALILIVFFIFFIVGHLGTPQLQASFIPNTQLTPGATRRVTRDDICAAGTIDDNQAVPTTVAHRVFEEYGIHNPPPRTYEVDYLITPALGGSADIHNLWPQPYAAGGWNSHVKDALEDRLRALVCEGKLDLSTAQRDIAVDWIAAYKKYFRTSQPLEIHAGFALDPPWE